MVLKKTLLTTLFFVTGKSITASPLTAIQDLSTAVLNKTRQTLNLSNVFGSQTSIPAYERIESQPVFTVTTPWGSPYLLFERADRTESNLEFDEEEKSSGKQDNTKQVALYFMDEEDAMRLRDEMLQMDQMAGADMRITASSLGKAIAQASNLHKGLLTGQPIDEHSGKMRSPDDGGVLRYKIVPPKRELFYAARCKGKERVGLWGTNPEDDARLMMQSVPVIGGTMAMLRKSATEKSKRNRRGKSPGNDETQSSEDDAIRNKYKHMEGFVGIPVFHCPEMKKYNRIKSIVRNEAHKMQSPLYFSYEDLMAGYSAMRSKSKDPSQIPETPNVEVYNLMDVITSIDREQWKTKYNKRFRAGVRKYIPSFFGEKNKVSTGLERVVFIPNSKSAKFKNQVSKVGNSKPRGLRPMRPWGRYMM
jgi:predicted DNA-binding protein (UPF0251 family)